jgi:tape measure domain-containing protein
VAQANVKLTVDATQAQRALKGVQAQSVGLQNQLGKLKAAFAGIAFTAIAKQSIQTAANFEKLNVRLGLLTKASGTFARSQEIAAEAQKSFGLSATEALEGITDITARLQPLGVSVEEIRTTFIGFNTAAKLAGASAMESSNAFRQLAQALGSGRLQGDEFRSIAEQVPTLLAPIAKELNTTVGGLKKFASEGKLTSDVVIRALKKVELDGAASLKELLENDPTQVFKDLGNEAENLSRAFGDVLAPAVLPVIRVITKVTQEITNFVNSGAGQVTLIFTGIAIAIKGVTIVVPILIGQLATMSASLQISAANSVLASTGLQGLAASSFLAAGGITKAAIALNVFKVALVKTGIGAAIVVLGTLAAKFIDNKNAAKESAKGAEDFNRQLGILKENGGEAAEIIEELAKKQRELNKERIRPATKRRLEDDIKELKTRQLILEGEKKRRDKLAEIKKFNDMTIASSKEIFILEEKINGKTDEQIDLEQKILDIRTQFEPEDAKQLISLEKKKVKLQDQLDLINKQKEAAQELKRKFDEIGQSVEDNLVQNLTDAVMGAQTLGQALSSVLRSLQRQLIELAISSAIGGIGGLFGGFLQGIFSRGTALNDIQNPDIKGAAKGGRIPAGQLTLVGEEGMELFVPSKSGTVIPNHALGGTTNVVVNVDAAGSSVEGDDQSANKLGELIAAAVQSEIINQQMSGGLLS